MPDDEDTKPSVMPPQPATQQLPAISPVEVALAKLGAAVDKGFTETRADLESVKNEGQRTNLRLTRLEMRQDDVETRLTRTSTRVKEVSEHDLDGQAQLADVIAWRRGVEEKLANTATKEDVKKVADAQTGDIVKSLSAAAEKHPTVRNLMLALAGLAFLAINTLTVYLTRPAPVQVPAVQSTTPVTVAK